MNDVDLYAPYAEDSLAFLARPNVGDWDDDGLSDGGVGQEAEFEDEELPHAVVLPG